MKISLQLIKLILILEEGATATSLTRKLTNTYSHTSEMLNELERLKIISRKKDKRKSIISIKKEIFSEKTKEELNKLIKIFDEKTET